MKNKKQDKTFNNIKSTNYTLFILMFYFNSIFYILFDIFNEYKIFFFLGNLVFMTIFYISNKIHSNEFEKQNNNIKQLITLNLSDSKTLLKTSFKYKDHSDTYKLFKRLYLKKNIIEQKSIEIEENFKKLIPEKFMNDIGKTFNENLSIGMSIEKKLHIMFIDISGFTKISEYLTPEKSLHLLNIYFDGIVEISKNNGGYVDKFLGDGIMIIFDKKNSDDIIKTGVEIIDFVKKINTVNIKNKVNIGIGINSGKAILGTIGSKDRMDITIIGDTVNVASRIEHLTRDEKEWIIFSEKTFNLIEKKNLFNIIEIGYKKIKGKNEKIKLFGIKDL